MSQIITEFVLKQ